MSLKSTIKDMIYDIRAKLCLGCTFCGKHDVMVCKDCYEKDLYAVVERRRK